MQNAVKHLRSHKDDANDEEESSLLADFSACMYEYDDKATFEDAFDTMRGKGQKQTWFDSIYKGKKEKWAECYMRDAFTLGMRSTQLSESLNNDLKHYLKSDLDIIHFMKQLKEF
jgi:zinc finger SWIM domain-containing protein 3